MEILRTGAPQRKALDRMRAERAAVLAQIDQLQDAPLPLDDAVAAALARLGKTRERGEDLLRNFGQPQWLRGDPTEVELAGLLIAIDPNSFEQQLRKKLKELQQETGPPQAARSTAIAKHRARLAELERLEEVEVCRLEAAGLIVDRRSDVEVAVLLKVWDSLDMSAEHS